MAIEIYPNIYRHEIPLPKNPLKALSCYIIKSEEKNLIIDLGFNKQECQDSLEEALKELEIDLAKTEVIITHLHSDHCGLAAEMYKKGVKIIAGRKEREYLYKMADNSYWESLESYKVLFGFGKDFMSFERHPGYRYSYRETIEIDPLDEGDIIEIAGYKFEVIDLPGHTPGQIGLYEKDHKILFSGDHVLDDITPNVAFWNYEEDMLAIYFESLRRVQAMDVKKIFTSHRNSDFNHRERIDELIGHHLLRLEEILEILIGGPYNIEYVASKMEWDIVTESWDTFPKPQKWFAAKEAMSHLEHLVHTGKVERSFKEEVVYYELK